MFTGSSVWRPQGRLLQSFFRAPPSLGGIGSKKGIKRPPRALSRARRNGRKARRLGCRGTLRREGHLAQVLVVRSDGLGRGVRSRGGVQVEQASESISSRLGTDDAGTDVGVAAVNGTTIGVGDQEGSVLGRWVFLGAHRHKPVLVVLLVLLIVVALHHVHDLLVLGFGLDDDPEPQSPQALLWWQHLAHLAHTLQRQRRCSTFLRHEAVGQKARKKKYAPKRIFHGFGFGAPPHFPLFFSRFWVHRSSKPCALPKIYL